MAAFYRKYFYALSVVHLLQVVAATAVCTYLGKTHGLGDTWVDANACDVCECNKYGVQCHAGLDGGPCKLNNQISRNCFDTFCENTLNGRCIKHQVAGTLAKPGDPACLYAQTKMYIVGDVFPAVDGCNKCLCTEQGMQCTAKACGANGFAQGIKTPIYGDCMDGHLWYRYQTQWRAADGCNTCFCYMVGNYRGQHVCTTSTCKCKELQAQIAG